MKFARMQYRSEVHIAVVKGSRTSVHVLTLSKINHEHNEGYLIRIRGCEHQPSLHRLSLDYFILVFDLMGSDVFSENIKSFFFFFLNGLPESFPFPFSTQWWGFS